MAGVNVPTAMLKSTSVKEQLKSWNGLWLLSATSLNSVMPVLIGTQIKFRLFTGTPARLDAKS